MGKNDFNDMHEDITLIYTIVVGILGSVCLIFAYKFEYTS